jgi:predicted metal-dependent phosphotriesterase family hydrolase
VARAAADRAKQSAELAAASAKAERAHNRGIGTVVDVTA